MKESCRCFVLPLLYSRWSSVGSYVAREARSPYAERNRFECDSKNSTQIKNQGYQIRKYWQKKIEYLPLGLEYHIRLYIHFFPFFLVIFVICSYYSIFVHFGDGETSALCRTQPNQIRTPIYKNDDVITRHDYVITYAGDLQTMLCASVDEMQPWNQGCCIVSEIYITITVIWPFRIKFWIYFSVTNLLVRGTLGRMDQTTRESSQSSRTWLMT